VQQHSDLPTDEGRGLVVFLQGLWMHPNTWSPWQNLFDSNGYDSVLAGASGTHGAGSKAVVASQASFSDLLDSTAAMLPTFGRKPILIGFGMGAVVAQVLLSRGQVAAAAVAIAPPVAGWVVKLAVTHHLRVRIALGYRPLTVAGRPTFAAFANGYANAVPEQEAAELYDRYVIPGSTRPILQIASSWRRPPEGWDGPRPPLLLISGGRDRLCPESGTRAWERFGRRHYPNDVTDHHVFPAAGHSLVIDAGWEGVANFCLDWLTSQDL
jgi:non-heme chloroperoxidase